MTQGRFTKKALILLSLVLVLGLVLAACNSAPETTEQTADTSAQEEESTQDTATQEETAVESSSTDSEAASEAMAELSLDGKRVGIAVIGTDHNWDRQAFQGAIDMVEQLGGEAITTNIAITNEKYY